MKKKINMVEIWGDVVDLKNLIQAIIISSISTMGMYALAPEGDKIKGLFFGLFGAVLGFTINTIFIKPKRVIVMENKEEGLDD